MNNLAMGYRDAGKLDQALPLFEETLKLRKAKLGPDDPDTLGRDEQPGECLSQRLASSIRLCRSSRRR